MAGKAEERAAAKHYYVNQHLEQKEIAKRVGVSERTVSEWVNKYAWKAERDAKLNTSKDRLEKIKRVISNITEQTIENEENRKVAIEHEDLETERECDLRAVGLADQISKWNKILENMDKENRISLAKYLEVMEDIFKALQAFDNALYLKTLDFQEEHVQTISMKLG